MVDRSGDASALLGMDGFVVLSQTEEDGELWVLVEKRADVAGCPSCGVRATGHRRSELGIRDLPAGGRPVRLVWRKRRWICIDPDCPAKSFTEASDLIEGCLSHSAATEICRRVGEDGHSVAQVAREFGVGWATAMACVRRHGAPLVDDPGRIGTTKALDIDEHKVLRATKDHHTLFATSNACEVDGQLLDVVPELTRLAMTISRWEHEVLRFHRTHISTGPVEAQNLVTEKIRRIAHGMRNFDNYRLRILLHSGVKWDTRPTARIRGRSPRLVA